jgi:flagellar motility protein MotE (MotC chaperone)
MSIRKRRAGRGVLLILALLLASSGALRIGADVGLAFALAPETPAEGDSGAALDCPAPPLALAEALSARETQVAAQESALAERLAALDLANTAIDQRLATLAAAEAELTKTLAMADGAAEADLARLTSVYEAMKPKDAAALFDSMAPEFASGFLGRMRPDAAAAVMSGMKPDTAYAVSVLLAGRNASVPKE